jgi:FkbM family methyltransferase
VSRLIKSTVDELLAAAGFHLVASWRMDHLAHARHLRRLFQYFAIDCVFDVGANEGQFRDFLRMEVEYRGVIVSFEPIPALADKMRARASTDSHWEVHDFALGASDCEMTLNVMKATDLSSFLAPRAPPLEASFAKHLSQMNSVHEQIRVPVRTLDSVFPAIQRRLGCGAPFLKLDTQGFDLEVARGGQEALPQMLAIQTEASLIPIYYGMPNYAEAISAFQSFGFDVSGLFPIDNQFPTLVEFDCVMVNRRSLVPAPPS